MAFAALPAAGAAAGISTFATVASTLVGVAGTLMSAAAQKQSADYQAAIASRNAQIARQQAKTDVLQGEQNQLTQDMKTRAMLGTQLAQQGASGLDVNEGSLTDIRASSAALGRYDALNVKAQAAMQAYNDKQQAQNFKMQSNLYEMQGDQASLAGYVGASGSLLGGAASLSSKWATWQMQGVQPSLSLNTP